MTTPKEALERIIEIYERNAGRQNEKLADIPLVARRALASIQGEDAVEMVAQYLASIDAFHLHYQGFAERNEAAKFHARAILATGLVPDEAAIRADEREKRAKFKASDISDQDMRDLLSCKDLASGRAMLKRLVCAAIRSGGGE